MGRDPPFLGIRDQRQPLGILADLQPEQCQELGFELDIVVGVPAQMREIENLFPCCIFVALGMVARGLATPVTRAAEHLVAFPE
jgi:hypothetical protein